MTANPLVRLGELGQSPWYDFITRDLVASGELARLIREDGLRGLTSNPTIFEKAVKSSADYDDDIRRLAEATLIPICSGAVTTISTLVTAMIESMQAKAPTSSWAETETTSSMAGTTETS